MKAIVETHLEGYPATMILVTGRVMTWLAR